MTSLALRALTCFGTLAALVAAAGAQPAPSYPGAPQPGGAQNVCLRLESQLAAIDRGTADPARAEQVRRYEEAAAKQQAELDKIRGQAQRLGCERSNFFLFGGQPAQCGPLNQQIQQMRSNLDRILSDLQRLQSPNGADQNGQRRTLLAALAQNDCGPQYRVATPTTQPRGIFDSLFGSNSVFGNQPNTALPESSTFRTVCVRTCDGFFWPISFATVPSKFQDDERTCQRMCPAAEVVLMSHRNPGEEVAQAVSANGRQYSQLPNAFRYRQQFDSTCSCKRPGESWAEALKNLGGDMVERGDIVVTEERARALSQPRGQQSGRPQAGAAPAAQPANEQPSPAANAETAPKPKGTVRTVGPQFLPVR